MMMGNKDTRLRIRSRRVEDVDAILELWRQADAGDSWLARWSISISLSKPIPSREPALLGVALTLSPQPFSDGPAK